MFEREIEPMMPVASTSGPFSRGLPHHVLDQVSKQYGWEIQLYLIQEELDSAPGMV